MKTENIEFREQLIYITWLVASEDLTMKEVAEMFGMTKGNIHRAKRKWADKEIDEFDSALRALLVLAKVVDKQS